MRVSPITLALPAALLLAGALGFHFASSGNATAQGANDLNKAELTELVREILVENPDIVGDALDALSAQEALREEAAFEENLDKHLPTLLAAENGYMTGATGDGARVAVIELFDYHCGFCKQATDLMQEIVAEEDDVRVIFKELPILRDESFTAAEYALAAREQGKYADLHFAMMNASGTLSEARIEQIAGDIGLDVAALKQAHGAGDFEETFMDIREIAIDLGITGTPSFVVASIDGSYREVIGGWDEAGVRRAIENARNAD